MSKPFQPTTSGRISAEIVEQVTNAIRRGELVPGDRLPPERDLTAQPGVSRVSVRDAQRVTPEMGEAGVVEHRAIVDAVRARDLPTARRVMDVHLARTAQRVAADDRSATRAGRTAA